MAVNLQVKRDDMQFATTLAPSCCHPERIPRKHSGEESKTERSEMTLQAPYGERSESNLTFRRTLPFNAAFFVLLCLLAFSHFALADADDPMEILKKARMNEAAQSIALDGQVRHGETQIPFRLTLDGGEIKYEFFNPDQTLVLQLGDKSARLVEVTRSGTERIVTDAQYDRTVRGTDITYEDLAMRFLYWPVAKIVGHDIMLTRNCWKL